MTKQEVFNKIDNLTCQVEFTTDLDAVVESMLKSHENYFLELNSKVKDIIEKKVKYLKTDNYARCFVPITFVDVCNWQKELYKYKQSTIKYWLKDITFRLNNSEKRCLINPLTSQKHFDLNEKLKNLSNPHISLGLRDFCLENLKTVCFSVSDLTYNCMEEYESGAVSLDGTYKSFHFENTKQRLAEWYKIFITIQFFKDFNEVLGMIVVNVLSYALIGKYLVISNSTFLN
jgi:hypothetical protein